MQLQLITAITAALAGSVQAYEITYYHSNMCRGARVYSESRSYNNELCWGANQQKNAALSATVTPEDGDDSSHAVHFFGDQYCGSAELSSGSSGCVDFGGGLHSYGIW